VGGLGAGKRLMGAGVQLMVLAGRLRAGRRHQNAGRGGGREFRLCSDVSELASYRNRSRWSVLRRGVVEWLSWGGVPSQNRDVMGHIAK